MSEHPWYSEEAGFFGSLFLDEYSAWMTPEITRRQVAFVVDCLGLDTGSSILDLACGDGRHTIELCRQGFQVTGLDLNQGFLGRAAASAEISGIEAGWVAADMRAIPFKNEFGAVLSLFTSFGFFSNEAENAEVLQQVAHALRPGGRFVLDVMNRDFVLQHFKPEECRRREDGSVWMHHRSFDPASNGFHHRRTKTDATGESSWKSVVRLYSLQDLDGLCRSAGLSTERTYGGYESEPWDIDQSRTILIARKIFDSEAD